MAQITKSAEAPEGDSITFIIPGHEFTLDAANPVYETDDNAVIAEAEASPIYDVKYTEPQAPVVAVDPVVKTQPIVAQPTTTIPQGA